MVLDCSIREDGYPFHDILLDKIFYIQGDDSYATKKKILSPGKKYLVYTISGEGTVVLDGQKFVLSATSYVHIAPKDHFSYFANGNLWEFWWFEYTGPSFAPVNEIRYASENPQISFLLEYAFRYSQQNAWDVACGMFLSLCALLDHCSVLYSGDHSNDGLFRSMDKFIRDNIQTITVGDLANFFKTEERSLRNFFHRQCNLPPKQYILKIRLEHASRLMLGSTLSLQSIALASGFCNAYHLSKCFKQQFSITPSQYRKKA